MNNQVHAVARPQGDSAGEGCTVERGQDVVRENQFELMQ
jgi:hypothetical protein